MRHEPRTPASGFRVQVGVTAHKHPMQCTVDGDYSLPTGAGDQKVDNSPKAEARVNQAVSHCEASSLALSAVAASVFRALIASAFFGGPSGSW